jgi:formate/nitrite transporter FocA (FNT family)
MVLAQFDLGLCRMPQPWEGQMTNSEQKVLWRGVAAGMLVGLATGLMIALFIVIATKPELFAALVR